MTAFWKAQVTRVRMAARWDIEKGGHMAAYQTFELKRYLIHVEMQRVRSIGERAEHIRDVRMVDRFA